MNDDDLHSLIRQTHPKPEFASSFQRETWARIGLAEEGSLTTRWRRAVDAFFLSLARPAPGAALITLMLLAGLGFGTLASSSPETSDLRQAYVQSINPLTAAAAASH